MPKLLVYYDGLANTSTVSGGSANAVLDFAKVAARSGLFDTIDCCGSQITYNEQLGALTLLPAPQPELASSFLQPYHYVVFCTNAKHFIRVQKPVGQRWVLFAHCWDLGPEELARLNDFDGFVALSSLHAAHLVESGVPANRVEVFPNHIDTDLFSPQPVERNPYALMFCGAIVDHKNVHLLMQVVIFLQQHIKQLELDIYGSAALWRASEQYEQMLRQYATPTIRFHSAVPRSELPKIYSQHGILCLPSALESFSLVSVEAQACGCIPVLHSAGGTGATLKDGSTGLLYAPNTPEALAQAIVKTLELSINDQDTRQRARAFAVAEFSEQRADDRFRKAFGALLL